MSFPILPAPYLTSFPKEWRNSLLSLEGFVAHIRTQQAGVDGIEKWTN
jgi:hypothetical protein